VANDSCRNGAALVTAYSTQDNLVTDETTSTKLPAHKMWLADGLLFLTATVWGINLLVFKHASESVDTFGFNAIRLILALATLCVLSTAELIIWPNTKPKGKIPWGQVLVFSLLNGLLYLLLFAYAVSKTVAGNIALIMASLPMWTALLSKFFYHERLPRITWIGIAVTFAGTVIVTTQSSREVSLSSEYFVGNLLMLVATMAWASATVASRTLMMTFTPLQLATISSALTTPIHVLIAISAIPLVWQQTAQPAVLAAIIYSGVLSTGVAYATWNAGVRMVGASHASVFQNVVTLVAVTGGWLALGEEIVVAQIVGGILTIMGLFLMRRGRNENTTENTRANDGSTTGKSDKN
jgi:drug/metabolite transporter (DMT)-like permease